MLNANFTNIRALQRNTKQLAEGLSKTDMTTIVMSRNQPLFAIVSLKSQEDFEQKKQKHSLQGLFDLAQWVRDNNISIPADLGENHNKYAWDE